MGGRGATLPPNSTGNVPSSCSFGEKGGRTNDLPRPPGPHTSREEIRDLYHQVYKLMRLLGSPPCGPEQAGKLMRDIVSSLKNHLRQKEDELPGAAQAAHPMQNRTPWGERGVTLAETQLAEAREAHWRALATTIALEEKIKWLSRSLTRDYPDTHAPSQS